MSPLVPGTNVPIILAQKYDLASPQYAMTKEQARTQYGMVKITDEKQNQKP